MTETVAKDICSSLYVARLLAPSNRNLACALIGELEEGDVASGHGIGRNNRKGQGGRVII